MSNFICDGGRVDVDRSAAGFISTGVDPLRYNGANDSPFEAAGIVLSMIPARARVLDVGCGTGVIATMVRDRCNATVIGIEPHHRRAEYARARGIEVHEAFLSQELIRQLGKFDIIIFADVLEHLADTASVLSIARHGLRNGGAIIASVPNVAHWSVRARLLLGKFNYTSTGIMDATHLRWFTRLTFRQMFESAGFEVEQMHASAGTWIGDYYCRPWRWIELRRRRELIRRAAQKWPGLFGCQHIVRATVARDRSSAQVD